MNPNDLPMAVRIFLGSWFFREQPKPGLTDVEISFIVATYGGSVGRWEAHPNLDRMKAIYAEHPEVLDSIGPRLLTVAVGMRGAGQSIRFLIEKGVPFEMDQTVYNTMHEAAWANATDTLQALFESGVVDATGISVLKPHTGWPDNLSLMYWAAWGGYVELAELLIKYGVSIHHELQIKGNGERGTTSLHEALAPSPYGEESERTLGRQKIAAILIEDGAYYDIYSSCARDDVARVQALLVEDEAIANLADPFNMTPLHWASRSGSESCMSLLLDHSADPNAMNNNNRTPAMLAADQDQADSINRLARRGADFNLQDKKGRTALHRAMYEGKPKAADALLEAGADPMLLNKNGKNAFQVARKDAKHFKQFA